MGVAKSETISAAAKTPAVERDPAADRIQARDTLAQLSGTHRGAAEQQIAGLTDDEVKAVIESQFDKVEDAKVLVSGRIQYQRIKLILSKAEDRRNAADNLEITTEQKAGRHRRYVIALAQTSQGMTTRDATMLVNRMNAAELGAVNEAEVAGKLEDGSNPLNDLFTAVAKRLTDEEVAAKELADKRAADKAAADKAAAAAAKVVPSPSSVATPATTEAKAALDPKPAADAPKA